MEKIFQIQNLKCEGCETTIIKNMIDVEGVERVELSVPESKITILADTALTLEKVRKKLSQLGYPVIGESNTFVKKARSYVSCAVGKLNN